MGPLNGFYTRWFATSVGKQLVASRAVVECFYVHCDHNALGTKSLSRLANKIRIKNSCRVNADLVCAGIQQAADISNSSNTTANREWNEHLRRDLLNGSISCIALLVTGRDIEKGDFISTCVVVTTSDLDRITRVANAYEVHAFDNAPLIDIEAGNNALRQAHCIAPA